MSDELTPATPESAEPAASPSPSIDFGPIMERFESLESRLTAQQPESAPEPEPDPYAELESYYEDPADAADARQLLESVLEAKLSAATKPLQDRLAALQADLELGDLEARYPELADNNELAQGILREAEEIARESGVPQLATSAKLLEKLYLARKGLERAASEMPAGGAPTDLEGAGGAAPGQPEVDLAQQILQARGAMTPARQFWGF